MKRIAAIAAVADLIFLAVVLHTEIKDFLFVHTWLFTALCATPALIIGIVGTLTSRDANRLQHEANELQRQNIEAQDQVTKLHEQANKYREEANRYRDDANRERARANEALGRIADHTKRAPTQAERNAERLRQNLRAKVQVVNADDSRWGTPAEIVEVKDEVVTLFSPQGYSSTTAFAVQAHCDNVEISEGSGGVLTIKVLQRYGTTQQFGQVKTWEERHSPQTAPAFSKGPMVFNAEYSKPGSADRMRLMVFEASDASNSYILETSFGSPMFGDNVGISRQFMLSQLEIETKGFSYNGGGTGGAHHQLFIRTRT